MKKIEDKMDSISKLQEDLKNPDPHFRQNAVIGFAKYSVLAVNKINS